MDSGSEEPVHIKCTTQNVIDKEEHALLLQLNTYLTMICE
jgi:hypothetical protein